MDEWTALKELEDLAELERREARSFSWDNARHWVLANAWGLLAAFALGGSAAYATLAAEPGSGTLGILTSVLAFLVVLPLVAGTLLLLWVGFFVVFPNFAGTRMQVVASLALCGIAAFVAHAGSPDAVRARRVHAEQKREHEKAHRDPSVSAMPADATLREGAPRDGAPGREGGGPPTLPEIAIERPPGGIRFTNNSAQTLTITAVLQPELGQVKTWTGRPIAECAQLAGPRGELPAPPTVLRPGEQVTFAGKPDCGGLETAPAQITVVDENRQPVVYTLKVLR